MTEKKYRFALVGCGGIAPKHAYAVKKIEGAELAAVCDTNETRAELIGKQYNVPFYKKYDEMLEKEKIDIVNILTPSGLHSEHTMDIVKKYKKHIVCEKPMALSLEQADGMIETCAAHGCRLFIVKQYRYNPPVQKLKEAVDSGLLGKLILGTVRLRWRRDQKYYDRDAWRGTRELDGGVLMNQASHHIDLLEWIMGEPVSVIGKTSTYLVNIETDNTAIALITFNSGAIGLIEATTATRPDDLEGSLSILGEKGSIVIGGFAANKLSTWNIAGQPEADRKKILKEYSNEPPNAYNLGHVGYLEHVIECIKSNVPEPNEGIEAKKSLSLIKAIYESAETGKETFIQYQSEKEKVPF
jgi:UDP-N-acetyl-2-amino-2-deoxyglucuronate dehydrogenase